MSMSKTVFLAADHRGFKLKGQLLDWLKSNGYAAKDLGTHSEERCDSIDYAIKMAEALKAQPDALGVILCGSGNGIAMAANRYKAIRAALCFTVEMAKLAREHNDANVLALGADVVSSDVAFACIDIFLKTKFLGGRYAERRDRITELGGL